MSIILASNSPRRRELLAQIGIRDFQILSPDVDEAVPPRTVTPVYTRCSRPDRADSMAKASS